MSVKKSRSGCLIYGVTSAPGIAVSEVFPFVCVYQPFTDVIVWKIDGLSDNLLMYNENHVTIEQAEQNPLLLMLSCVGNRVTGHVVCTELEP